MKSSPGHGLSMSHFVLSVALVASLSWVGCSDQVDVTPTAPDELSISEAPSGPPVTLQERDLGPALAAQRRHGPRLKAIPGVVGHGVGLVDGEPGIKVFLLTPGVPGIPSRVDGIPVAAEVTGMFVADEATDPTSHERPAPNGFSIGHPDITAGTLGAIVQGASGICYALSNNHVLANANKAKIGDSALQPGPYDGGQDPGDAIGTLDDFEIIAFDGSSNTIDAAIAKLFDPLDATGSTPSYAYGAPGPTDAPATLEMAVKKFGRTTSLTHGTVQELGVTVDVCYECLGPFCGRCKKLATFTGQIATGDMSDGGDSGSLIVTDDAFNRPVGLLFAGSSTRTLANPIQDVFARFGVSIVSDLGTCNNGGTGGNVPPTADFSFAKSDLTVTFTDHSSDDDGSVVTWDWDFGDDAGTSAGQNPSYTYPAAGTYTVTLTVTDNGGLTDSFSQPVSVSEAGGGEFTLTTTVYKEGPWDKADLIWSGATTSKVAVFRNGEFIVTTANDGAYTDRFKLGSATSVSHQVCEAEGKTPTDVCSNIVEHTY